MPVTAFLGHRPIIKTYHDLKVLTTVVDDGSSEHHEMCHGFEEAHPASTDVFAERRQRLLMTPVWQAPSPGRGQVVDAIFGLNRLVRPKRRDVPVPDSELVRGLQTDAETTAQDVRSRLWHASVHKRASVVQ